MSLVDVATLRSIVQTDVGDPGVQLLIDSAEKEITDVYGSPAGPTTVILSRLDYSLQNTDTIYLERPLASITSVTEVWGDEFSETTTILDATDYRIVWGGHALLRIGSGTNKRWLWGHRVTVVYVPVDDTLRRKEIITELVKLALRHSGVRSQGEGVTAETSYEDYAGERAQLIRSMSQGTSFS